MMIDYHTRTMVPSRQEFFMSGCVIVSSWNIEFHYPDRSYLIVTQRKAETEKLTKIVKETCHKKIIVDAFIFRVCYLRFLSYFGNSALVKTYMLFTLAHLHQDLFKKIINCWHSWKRCSQGNGNFWQPVGQLIGRTYVIKYIITWFIGWVNEFCKSLWRFCISVVQIYIFPMPFLLFWSYWIIILSFLHFVYRC